MPDDRHAILAQLGQIAYRAVPHLLNGLNVDAGHLSYYAVGKALGINVMSPALVFKA